MSEDFDFDGTQSKGPGTSMQIWDILSILVLVITVCLIGYFALVFVNPESPLNILPPGGGPFGNPLPTLTATPRQLEPTWTPSPTLALTPSNTPRPTFTPIFTDTPFSLVPPTKTAKPTNTSKVTFTFSVTVEYRPSTIWYPDLGCSYFGVAGEAVDDKNGPYRFGIVKVGGILDGQVIDPELHTTVTAVAPQFGPAGFEIKIPELTTLVDSRETLWIQLFDTAGTALSDRKYFNTYEDCERNLIQVRFKATKPIQ